MHFGPHPHWTQGSLNFQKYSCSVKHKLCDIYVMSTTKSSCDGAGIFFAAF